MKNSYSFVLVLILFIGTKANGQLNETFEDESVNSPSFTNNGATFDIASSENYDVLELAGAGWNGTTVDNKFVDNSANTTNGGGTGFTITKDNGDVFVVIDLYLFCSRHDLTPHTGTLIIKGRKNNIDIYTITKNSGFSNTTTFMPNNGFTYIDFATEGASDYSDDIIDELVVSSTGNLDYMALDAFQWNSVILPIELLSFKGLLRDNTIHLTWETSQELNNEKFEIERSIDAINFKKIGEMKGNRTSNTKKDYAFLDKKPSSNTNYYRLKQTDFDGKFEYSQIVRVFMHDRKDIVISPNPTNGIIHLDNFSEGEIKIYGISGNLLKKTMLKGQDIDISDLPNGILLIHLITETQNSIDRILKN